jgi:TonB-linked SusC/RagA family outer membrane protein
MKTILSSDYFLSRIVKILGEIGFVPGCLILLVLMTMSSFASAHYLPNSLKDHESFDLKTSSVNTVTANEKNISELTPGLNEEHPHGGRISYPTFPSNHHCHPDEGRISFYPQESQNITGTIYDAGGGIPGVVVKIKGTNIFTLTNEFGHFEINAKKGDILIFSYPDYETVEIKITDQTEINLELFPAVTQLEEAVINAGYYTVKDKEKTGSIYKVNKEDLENQKINTLLDALQGRVPGVNIVSNTGLAGGSYSIQIRGKNSINAGNEPLYIIDGVPYDMGNMGSMYVSGMVLPGAMISPLNTLDPASIESVEILKDADATAIYGSRGANGVILIKTKKGGKDKTQITLETSYSIIQVPKKLNFLNTQEYIRMREKAFENDGFEDLPFFAYDINGTWDRERYTDWQEYFLGNTAINQSVRFQVEGGNEHTNFHVGGSHMKESTIFPNDYHYKRYSANFGLNHQSSNKKFQLNFSGSFGKDSNLLPGSELWQSSIYLPPNAPELFEEDGSLNWENNTWDNPLAALNSEYKNKSSSLVLNSSLGYEVVKGLKFRVNMGFTQAVLEEIRTNPHTVFNPSWGLTTANSGLYKNEGKRESWILEPQLEWNSTLGSGNLSLMVGGSLQDSRSESLAAIGSGFTSNYFIENLSAAKTITYLNDLAIHYRYLGMFARVNYTLNKKYILNVTGRRDGSSRFGTANRFANFGAIGAAWLFSKENYFENLDWLSFGKLRGSIGITGNDQIGDYQYLSTYTIGDGQYNGNLGISPSNLFNPDFSWEESRKAEAALEMSFLKNNLSFELAYYHHLSKRQLTQIPLPSTTGFAGYMGNMDAEVLNTGWELALNVVLLNEKKWKWNASFLMSVPRNELKSFQNLEESPYAHKLVIGLPITINRLYHFTGLNAETGLFEFEDYNQDGVITEEDRKFNQDFSPKFHGSLRQNLSYQNFSLDFMFQFMKKQAFNSIRNSHVPGLMYNQSSEFLIPGEMQDYTMGNNAEALSRYSFYKQSDAAVSDASFIRLKSLNLSYKLPSSLIGIGDCILSLHGSNLFTLSKYKGFDPEQTLDFTPLLRRISLGAKFIF